MNEYWHIGTSAHHAIAINLSTSIYPHFRVYQQGLLLFMPAQQLMRWCSHRKHAMIRNRTRSTSSLKVHFQEISKLDLRFMSNSLQLSQFLGRSP